MQPKEVERKVEVAKEKIHDKKETIEKTKEETKTITLEEVRAALAKKSQEGKQKNVKDLITKYGAVKLSEIPSDKYLNLLKEAEMI
ncbi:hypothetical protein FDF77_06595 [Clostridium sporogenes]|nr:hypothetical protein [Clostridium sporogenes]NFQ61182.1 hypothetical protein [Clostridium sporogenes]NFU09095.1 hypothetical protein [Clostridium sporogenes]NFU42214.1 hypothetical protein [Clostridium sporogenes]NFU61229.1 hypothetical protein [Clostridium sporogenes]